MNALNTNECPKGGEHHFEATDDGTGEVICVNCLEPRGEKEVSKMKTTSEKKEGKPAKKATKKAAGKKATKKPTKKAAGKKAKPASKKAATKKEEAFKAAEATAEATAKPAAPKKPKAEKAAGEAKGLSLIKAAWEVLKRAGKDAEMNTVEMVKAATDQKIWEPKAGKTPERTLSAAIHREIKLAGAAASFAVGKERGKFRAV